MAKRTSKTEVVDFTDAEFLKKWDLVPATDGMIDWICPSCGERLMVGVIGEDKDLSEKQFAGDLANLREDHYLICGRSNTPQEEVVVIPPAKEVEQQPVFEEVHASLVNALEEIASPEIPETIDLEYAAPVIPDISALIAGAEDFNAKVEAFMKAFGAIAPQIEAIKTSEAEAKSARAEAAKTVWNAWVKTYSNYTAMSKLIASVKGSASIWAKIGTYATALDDAFLVRKGQFEDHPLWAEAKSNSVNANGNLVKLATPGIQEKKRTDLEDKVDEIYLNRLRAALRGEYAVLVRVFDETTHQPVLDANGKAIREKGMPIVDILSAYGRACAGAASRKEFFDQTVMARRIGLIWLEEHGWKARGEAKAWLACDLGEIDLPQEDALDLVVAICDRWERIRTPKQRPTPEVLFAKQAKFSSVIGGEFCKDWDESQILQWVGKPKVKTAPKAEVKIETEKPKSPKKTQREAAKTVKSPEGRADNRVANRAARESRKPKDDPNGLQVSDSTRPNEVEI